MKTLKKIKKYSVEVEKIINHFNNYFYIQGVSSPRNFICLYNISGDSEKIGFLNVEYFNYLNIKIINEIDNFVEIIKMDFQPKKIWVSFYTPKTGLDFHYDNIGRHIVNLNIDDHFYYLELTPVHDKNDTNGSQIEKMSQLLHNDMETFLSQFKKNKDNKILTLEEGSVYMYDEVVSHTFYNNSENKVRVSFIFDV